MGKLCSLVGGVEWSLVGVEGGVVLGWCCGGFVTVPWELGLVW